MEKIDKLEKIDKMHRIERIELFKAMFNSDGKLDIEACSKLRAIVISDLLPNESKNWKIALGACEIAKINLQNKKEMFLLNEHEELFKYNHIF